MLKIPADPLILVIDTSTAIASVGIGRGHEALAQVHASAPRAYDEGIVPRIHEALAQAGCSLADLGVIACGRGPGSFTGLRIAMATAKGYAMALDRPLVTVSSTAATALGARDAGSVVVAIDAKRGQVHVEAFDLRAGAGGGPREVAAMLLDATAVTAWIAGLGLAEPVALVGEAAGLIPVPPDRASAVIAMGSISFPRAEDLLALAAIAAARGAFADADAVEPEYVRPPPITVSKRGLPRR